MNKNRLEAFSDGVLAIIITIMVLEIQKPHGTNWAALRPMIPIALSYLFSFIYVGIFWNNHHHLFHITKSVNGKILWANLHLLFWISLLPFGTAWIDENHFSALPVAFYGTILFMCSVAWKILTNLIIRYEGPDSRLKRSYRGGRKTWLSIIGYLAAIGLACCYPILSVCLYVIIAFTWFMPNTKIEHTLEETN